MFPIDEQNENMHYAKMSLTTKDVPKEFKENRKSMITLFRKLPHKPIIK